MNTILGAAPSAPRWTVATQACCDEVARKIFSWSSSMCVTVSMRGSGNGTISMRVSKWSRSVCSASAPAPTCASGSSSWCPFFRTVTRWCNGRQVVMTSLCWVDYKNGFFLCDMADEARPKVRYLPVPPELSRPSRSSDSLFHDALIMVPDRKMGATGLPV
jgi:hypothetical protein